MNVFGLVRLTRDPERKTFDSGKAIVKVSLAWSDGFGDYEKSCFIEATAFGKSGDALFDYVIKGQKIAIINAKLIMDTWDDRETGKKRQAHKLKIFEWEFAEKKGADGGSGSGGSTSSTSSREKPASRKANHTGTDRRDGMSDDMPWDDNESDVPF